MKKTIDEIYSSTTWKIASKFTGGKAKREKKLSVYNASRICN